MAGLIAGIVARPLVGLAGAAAGLAVAFGGGVAFEHRGRMGPPIGWLGQSLKVQRDDALTAVGAAQAEARGQRALAAGWEASFRGAEALRGAEHGAAVTAAQVASGACEARVAAARRSAASIDALVRRPPARVAARPDGTCPAREVITGAELDGVFGR